MLFDSFFLNQGIGDQVLVEWFFKIWIENT